TRRSRSLREHRGEVAFPGGRLLPDESPVDAALREAREEIGVDPAKVEILGQLTPLGTVSTRQSVQCFVGSLTHTRAIQQAFVANASEVERVFWVPLAHLAMEGVYHEELWPAPEEGGLAWRAVPFFQIGGYVVWGATGRLLTELLTRVLVARIRHTRGTSPP
ncbi:MAG TPA: CoA pyrophosphatase, partial [Acidimicrobiales bacterium]|nr:CoA pyrophosphatase [Acidimicrobiales bacterium]